jgi:serine/threonine protein kinase
MAPDPAIEGFFKLIEARRDIGGRFTNIRRVGAGNFSLVFAAADNTLNHDVAIKVFRPEYLLQPYRYQCFCREAMLLNQLRGSRNVLDWIGPQGEFTERVTSTTGIPLDFQFPYFAVELASSDVGEAVRSGSWSAEERLLGFREMCKGVQRIHRKGISHRDLKPSNFLVMDDGVIKLSDFGTARDVNGSLLTDLKHDFESACRVAEEGLERYPLSPLLMNNLAYSLLMGGQTEKARRVLESVPRGVRTRRLDTPTVLAATWGLLYLWEGRVEKGKEQYKAAELLARESRQLELPNTVRQKMHLEIARAYLRQQDISAAKVEISRGLSVRGGRDIYAQDLEALRDYLEDLQRSNK